MISRADTGRRWRGASLRSLLSEGKEGQGKKGKTIKLKEFSVAQNDNRLKVLKIILRI